MADHYAVLGVQPDADRAAIQAAYRMLARLHHPDFGGDGSRMAALNEAWSVLGRHEWVDEVEGVLGSKSDPSLELGMI